LELLVRTHMVSNKQRMAPLCIWMVDDPRVEALNPFFLMVHEKQLVSL
jgi:hypothetical protein